MIRVARPFLPFSGFQAGPSFIRRIRAESCAGESDRSTLKSDNIPFLSTLKERASSPFRVESGTASPLFFFSQVSYFGQPFTGAACWTGLPAPAALGFALLAAPAVFSLSAVRFLFLPV